MKKNLFTASEIAEMRIPGLPTSRGAVIERAKREEWAFEMGVGRGGEHRLYELPDHYEAKPAVIKARRRGGIDEIRLAHIVKGVEIALSERGKKLAPAKKAQLIVLLYEQTLEADSKAEVDALLERLMSLTL